MSSTDLTATHGTTTHGIDARWQISSFCGGSGCVAVNIGGEVRVRDSKLTTSPELVFDADEWTAFVAGVKAGEFDL